MRLKKFIPYFLSLFLGFNTLNAQNREEEPVKTYIIDEVIVDEAKIREEKQKELKEECLEKVIYGNSVKALAQDPNVQTSASNLISRFFIQGVPADVLAGFYIGNVPILGSPWQQRGVSTIFDSKLFSKVSVTSEGFSAKYDDLIGVIKTEMRDYIKKDFSFEVSSNLLERYILVNAPLSLVNGSLAVYVNNKEPLGFLERNISELKFLDNTKSYQAYLQLFNGKLNLATLNFFEDNDVTDDIDNKTIKLIQMSRHNLITANFNHSFGDYIAKIDFGYEYWGKNLNQSVSDNKNRIDLGTRNYTLNLEGKDKLGFNTLGFTFYSITNNGLNDLNIRNMLADNLFNQALENLDEHLTLEQKDSVTNAYYEVPDRYDNLVEVYDEILPGVYADSTRKDINDLEEYQEYYNIIHNFSLEGYDNSILKRVNAWKLYYDKKIFVNSLLPRTLLLEPSFGISNFKNKFAFSSGVNLTYDFGLTQVSLGYAHKANFLERNNIESAFKKEDKTKTQVADHYLASVSFSLDNKLIDDIVVHFYYKEYGATSKNQELNGHTKGFTTSIKKDSKLSYNLGISLLKSEVNGHPYQGSIDKTVNLSNSFTVNNWLSLFSNLRYQDGYWTNRIFSQKYKKLKNSVFADIGVSVTPNLFKENDLRISIGGYNLFGSNPIYDFEDKIVYAPTTGSISVTYKY